MRKVTSTTTTYKVDEFSSFYVDIQVINGAKRAYLYNEKYGPKHLMFSTNNKTVSWYDFMHYVQANAEGCISEYIATYGDGEVE